MFFTCGLFWVILGVVVVIMFIYQFGLFGGDKLDKDVLCWALKTALCGFTVIIASKILDG